MVGRYDPYQITDSVVLRDSKGFDKWSFKKNQLRIEKNNKMTEIIEKITKDQVTGYICDSCKSHIDLHDDHLSIKDTGGYNSQWGDGTKWEIDLCDPCTFKLFNKIAREERG